jgi:hypothetical protein
MRLDLARGVLGLAAVIAAVIAVMPAPAPARTGGGVTGIGAAGAPGAADVVVGPGQPMGRPECAGWSGVAALNPAEQIMSDVLAVRGFAPVDVGEDGDINWSLDPYHHSTWRQWLHGLRWLGALISSPQPAHQARAVTVVRDWLADNDPDRLSQGARAATPERTQVLVCLVDVVGSAPWLVEALDAHARILATHFSGDWNQGLDQTAALFTVGCVLGREDAVTLANQRIAAMTPQIVDAQGVSNEQAPGYHAYVYRRISEIDTLWQECGQRLPDELLARQAKMPEFIAQATLPDGTLVQLGDTSASRPAVTAGTVADYPLSQGATGVPPNQRVAVYGAGYVFGRDHWRPFGTSTHYSLRFGPPRARHGHLDHGSVTWWAQGHPVLVDTGHVGYETGWRRDHVRSRRAHNKLVAPEQRGRTATASLSGRASSPVADVFEVTVPEYDGATWVRTILFARELDVVVVYDRLPTQTVKRTEQYWHLPAGSQVRVGPGLAEAHSADGQVRTRIVQVPLPGQSLPAGDTTVVAGRFRPGPPLGWLATNVRQWQPAPVVVAAREEARTRQLTVLAATAPEAELSTRLRRLGANRYELTVAVNDQQLVVSIDPDGWLRPAAP